MGAAQSVTVSAWVRVRVHKQHNWVLGTADRQGGFALFVDAGEKVNFGLFQEQALLLVATKALQLPHAWHYVTGVYNGTHLVVLVDGKPGSAMAVKPVHLTLPFQLLFGAAPDLPMLRLDGELGPVHVWGHARSPDQVAADMFGSWAEPPAFPAGLLGAWGHAGLQIAGLVVARPIIWECLGEDGNLAALCNSSPEVAMSTVSTT
ncbi:hypothetical protein WJX72_007631 [[Myrmecia] bisecta]|uniref:Uncharacterized protein n=1 Tax=[Myrmecia] bisecta TaxID=41462 RepID=A0AAW1PLU6_9CHLO